MQRISRDGDQQNPQARKGQNSRIRIPAGETDTNCIGSDIDGAPVSARPTMPDTSSPQRQEHSGIADRPVSAAPAPPVAQAPVSIPGQLPVQAPIPAAPSAPDRLIPSTSNLQQPQQLQQPPGSRPAPQRVPAPAPSAPTASPQHASRQEPLPASIPPASPVNSPVPADRTDPPAPPQVSAHTTAVPEVPAVKHENDVHSIDDDQMAMITPAYTPAPADPAAPAQVDDRYPHATHVSPSAAARAARQAIVQSQQHRGNRNVGKHAADTRVDMPNGKTNSSGTSESPLVSPIQTVAKQGHQPIEPSSPGQVGAGTGTGIAAALVQDRPEEQQKGSNQKKRSKKKKVEKAENTDSSSVKKRPRRFRHKRIRWIDTARGIAILTIIIMSVAALFGAYGVPAHVPPSIDSSVGTVATSGMAMNFLSDFADVLGAYGFPLLFVSLGYTIRRQKMTLAYLADLFGKYMLPYAIFGLVSGAIYSLLANTSFAAHLAALAYGNGGIRGDFLLPPPFGESMLPVLWMLPTILLGQLTAFLLSRIPLITRIVAAAALFLLGDATAGHIFLPFDIQQAMCVSWFMTCGMILREKHAFSVHGGEQVVLAIVLTIGIVYAALVFMGFFTVADYPVSNYQGGAVDMLGGVILAAAAMSIARIVSLGDSVFSRYLTWAGRNFLVLICSFTIYMSCALGVYERFLTGLSGMYIWGVFMVLAVAGVVLSSLLAWSIGKVSVVNKIFDHFADPEKESQVV